MARLIMWNIITVDGFFDSEIPWELPFHKLVWGTELEKFSLEQLRSASYLLFGRKTYEGMAGYWTTAEGEIAGYMNRLPKLVVSNSLENAAWHNSRILGNDISAQLTALKRETDKDIYLFGSADLSHKLISENLFDEYRIGIAPVILGHGRRLFSKVLSEKMLSLISCERLSNGGLIIKYKPAPVTG